MSFLAATAVTLRVALILMAAAMNVGFRTEIWVVLRKKPGWQTHLSTFVFTALVNAGAIICSVNVFPDAGWEISRTLRLTVVNMGLGVFLVGVLTGLYRRALKSGPEKARAAMLCGAALLLPGIAFVALLTGGGG